MTREACERFFKFFERKRSIVRGILSTQRVHGEVLLKIARDKKTP